MKRSELYQCFYCRPRGHWVGNWTKKFNCIVRPMRFFILIISNLMAGYPFSASWNGLFKTSWAWIDKARIQRELLGDNRSLEIKKSFHPKIWLFVSRLAIGDEVFSLNSISPLLRPDLCVETKGVSPFPKSKIYLHPEFLLWNNLFHDGEVRRSLTVASFLLTRSWYEGLIFSSFSDAM